MMAKVSSKVQEQEKIVKQKTWKARLKNDAHSPPEHDKVKKKSPQNDVRSPLNRTQLWGAQKERNGTQQIDKQKDRNPPQTAPTRISEVTKREQGQVGQRKLTRSSALERMKKSEVKVLRRPQNSSATQSKRNTVPLQPTLRSVTMPLPLTYGENQASIRTRSRAQALLVEMVQQSRLNTPGAQQHGLSALATELPVKQKLAEVTEVIVVANNNVPRGEVEGENYRKEDITQTVFGTESVGESNYLQGDDITQIVITEVSESTEPRFITPKEVSLFEDWRPGSQKLDKPPSVDRNHWLRVEMEKQQELRLAQKKATRKKEMRYLRRFEGAGVDDTNLTPLSIYSSQSIAYSTIREDVEEESARGYAKFLYRPGAAWRNLGSDSASSLRSFGRPESIESRPKSCESRKSTTEIVFAISSASARREAMRKKLAERLREDLLRKKLLVSQNRAAARHSQCTCC